ncbi:ribose 5-phosphate isomerase B [Desulfovibrio sp. OttesenSCG-928-A18]|nr:ribose 5-phosphate isomerase B [Desulfovibrio sp. OttesenSCG-928-A18]
MPEALFIASDHAGFQLKEDLKGHFTARGWKLEDLGAHSEESCDYPLFAHALCAAVLRTGHRGILICGTGLGMCMTANRHQGIRAAMCTHEFQAQAARRHNDANVLCLGARITAPGLARVLADLFLETAFDGGRHQRRVELMDGI